MRMVPMACFTGVMRPAAAKEPVPAPIIPGVAILAILGIYLTGPEALLVARQGKCRSLKQLKWWPEIWCENYRGRGACKTSRLNLRLPLLF